MKNMKTLAVAATIASASLVLAACGSSSDSADSAESTATETSAEETAAEETAAEETATEEAGSDSGMSDMACVGGSIQSAGSSAQANAITEWVNAYQTACPDATIDYQPVGSGAGVESFVSGQVSFAGTDSAVVDDEMAAATERCGGSPAINIPMVGGAIAIAYNLEGVDSLTLSPDAIAGIFSSQITNWNDPAIAATNEGVTLPDATIAQFHRSDSSGTTANFSAYLATVAPDIWTYDSGKEWTAPGGQGAKGSDQVIASVEQTPNSIGYVDLSYVLEAVNAKSALLDQGGGAVEATAQNASNALSAAEIVGEGNDLVLSIDYGTTAEGAYPITLVTYELACTGGLSEDQNPELVKAFLSYAASDEGQSMLESIGYVPITGDLLDKVRTSVDSLQ